MNRKRVNQSCILSQRVAEGNRNHQLTEAVQLTVIIRNILSSRDTPIISSRSKRDHPLPRRPEYGGEDVDSQQPSSCRSRPAANGAQELCDCAGVVDFLLFQTDVSVGHDLMNYRREKSLHLPLRT